MRKKANIVVGKDASCKYKSISDALKKVPKKSDKRFVIYVKKGVYYENVLVDKDMWNVVMVGDGMTATIVSGSLNFVDGTPTFATATFGKTWHANCVYFFDQHAYVCHIVKSMYVISKFTLNILI